MRILKPHSLGLGVTARRTRRRDCRYETEKLAPWDDLSALASPNLPQRKRGPTGTFARGHVMHQFHGAVVRLEQP